MLPLVLCIAFVAVSHAAFAETDVDFRIKLGSAASVNRVVFKNLIGSEFDSDVSGESSRNFQIEAAISPRQDSTLNFVGTIGLFGRHHAGHVEDPILPADIQYDASGLSGSVGISFRVNETVHFEGSLELSEGLGKPALTSPGFTWNETKKGDYTAISLILGAYTTMTKPGLQLGLELGLQSFFGNFQVWNGSGWADGQVAGIGGTANVVIGYRF